MRSFYSGVQNAISKWLLERDHDHTRNAELTENRISLWNSQRTTVVVMSWYDDWFIWPLYSSCVLWRFIIRPRVVPLSFGPSYLLIASCVTRMKNFTRALFPQGLFTVTINGLSERDNTQSNSDSALCEAKTICGMTSPWVTVLALFYESVNRLTESKKKQQHNVSKISVSLYYQQIGSISTNHSPLAWSKEGLKVAYQRKQW